MEKLNHFFRNVLIKLSIHGWELNLIPGSSEGYCWKNKKVIDLGLKNKNPKELLLHEIAHITTCRFCNQKHTPAYWKLFRDYMRRFLPGQEISVSMKNHMLHSSEGIYSLVYKN